MNGGIPVVNLFGIEVRVSLSLAVMVGFVVLIGADQAGVMAPGMAEVLQWLVGVGVAVLFLMSVVTHELAHALVGRRRGVASTSVVLGLIGGMAPLSIEAKQPRDELAIALAGPIASLAIAAVVLPLGIGLAFIGSPVGPIAGGLFVVGALNVMLGLASLLPGLPLDGGRVVRALAWMRTGDQDRASSATARAGRLMGWAIVGIGFVMVLVDDVVLGLLLVAMGWLLGSASRTLEQRAEMERLLRGVTVADAMQAGVQHVAPHLTLDVFAGQLGTDGAPSAVPVLDGDRLLGVIGVRALRRAGVRRWPSLRASDVMAVPPQAPFVAPGDAAWGVMETMQRRGLDGLAVVEEGSLVGMVTRESASEALRSRLPATYFWRGRR
jgi:Zn-dependent protease/CBS domain-containing protein